MRGASFVVAGAILAGGALGRKYDVTDLPDFHMVHITGDTFKMGVMEDYLRDLSVNGVNFPAHYVDVSDYYMQTTEVTNAQYLEFLNTALERGDLQLSVYINEDQGDEGIMVNAAKGDYAQKPLIFIDGVSSEYGAENRCYIAYDRTRNYFYLEDESAANLPVTYVRWFGAVAFAEAYGFRLPTNAEWEYAARGAEEALEFGTADGTFDLELCNMEMEYKTPLPVGSFAANPLGLYDLCGNVWEWTMDFYLTDYYECSPKYDPHGPEGNLDAWESFHFVRQYNEVIYDQVTKIMRGGSYNYHKFYGRSTSYQAVKPQDANDHFGFRVVKSSLEYSPETPEDCSVITPTHRADSADTTAVTEDTTTDTEEAETSEEHTAVNPVSTSSTVATHTTSVDRVADTSTRSSVLGGFALVAGVVAAVGGLVSWRKFQAGSRPPEWPPLDPHQPYQAVATGHAI